MIAIVDYGVNNLQSVRNAFVSEGGDVVVTSEAQAIEEADALVLPGIGAAAAGMAKIREREIEDVLKAALSRKPVLAICLGMQLLFDWSGEGDEPCLGLVGGRVRVINGPVKVPHMGWNQVATRPHPMWNGIGSNPYFYFVHSYVCDPLDRGITTGETDYGTSFASAIASGRIWATQFHPERSGRAGRQLIRNFVEYVCEPEVAAGQTYNAGQRKSR